MWFLRREASRHDVDRHLADPRSLDGWALAGQCADCWAELEDYDLVGEPETVIADALNLEPVPSLALYDTGPQTGQPRSDGTARCGHNGTAYARFLPGLCALATWDTRPTDAEARAAGTSETYSWLPLLVLYEGEEVGVDPVEQWALFRPRLGTAPIILSD